MECLWFCYKILWIDAKGLWGGCRVLMGQPKAGTRLAYMLWSIMVQMTKQVQFWRVVSTTIIQGLCLKQVHSLCVNSRTGDQLRLAKGDPPFIILLSAV